jgi:alkylated DNA repair dioxygenase AlkB
MQAARRKRGAVDSPLLFPEGFSYKEDVISEEEEAGLVAQLKEQPFKEFEFQGFTGKRRVVSYGWRYDFNGGGLKPAEPIPSFLYSLRSSAASFAALAPEALAQVLLTEYQPGAPIGWHKDRSVFGVVVGVSLLSASTFRLRRKQGAKWERLSLALAPRSMYVLDGPVRSDWEHSIPPVEDLRYSVTFRSLKRVREPS